MNSPDFAGTRYCESEPSRGANPASTSAKQPTQAASCPAGWALGPDGEPTQEAHAALHGTLLPFGSHRGGNIALLVEILATLYGASFSLDAAAFHSGSTSPRIGVFLLCIDPASFDGSIERLSRQFESLRRDHQVHLPAPKLTSMPDSVEIRDDLFRQLRSRTGSTPHQQSTDARTTQ